MKATKVTVGTFSAVVWVFGFLLVEPVLGGGADKTAVPFQSPSIETPFELHEHLVVVKGSVNGMPDLNLIIDTGNTVTVMSKRLRKKLKLQTGTDSAVSWGSEVKMETGRLDELALGEAVFRDVEVLVADLPKAKGLRIDLAVGLNVLRLTPVTIDYEHRLLVFGSHEEFNQHADFRPDLPILLIGLRVQGTPLVLLLDTGAPRLVFFKDQVEDRIALVETGERERIGHAGGSLTLEQVRLSEARLGQTGLADVTAYLIDAPGALYGGVDGFFSPTSLGLKRLNLNFETHQIGWEL